MKSSHEETSINEQFRQVYRQLYEIEESTKQNQVDLAQLIERLKNNNVNLNKLLESLVNSNINARDIIDPVVEELKEKQFDEKSRSLLTDILASLKDQRSNNTNTDGELKQILQEICDNQQAILKKYEMEQKTYDIQHKFHSLNSKYNELCKVYESKYQSLVILQKQYDELLTRSKTELQDGLNNNQHLNNIQELHNLKLRLIPKRTDNVKRVVSTSN